MEMPIMPAKSGILLIARDITCTFYVAKIDSNAQRRTDVLDRGCDPTITR